MLQGYALHIGLNRVDPAAYGGWEGRLQACVNDARSMDAITRQLHYTRSEMLLDDQATSEAILGTIENYRRLLAHGDLLKISYSGHGGQMPDPWGIYDTVETWCAYDRQILGHELAQIWAAFPTGSRVLVVSDSCHAGTVTRQYELMMQGLGLKDHPEFKSVPPEVQEAIDARQAPGLQRLFRGFVPPRPTVPVYLLGACATNQLSSDGRVNGLYTEKLLEVWGNGLCRCDYPAFNAAIARRMPPWQSPTLFVQGPPDVRFLRSRPFSI